MSVLKYIASKFKNEKIKSKLGTKSIRKEVNTFICEHNECTCSCHQPHSGLIHSIPCCQLVVCKKCDSPYYKMTE